MPPPPPKKRSPPPPSRAKKPGPTRPAGTARSPAKATAAVKAKPRPVAKSPAPAPAPVSVPAGRKAARGGGGKLHWPPGALLAPVPAVLASCCRPDGSGANLITLAWAGTVNSEPPVVAVGVRPGRHSHDLIRDTGEFVINLAGAAHAEGLDRCGVLSGRDTDKWAAAGFTPEPAATVKPPLVAESPLSLECRVIDARPLGSHTMFLGEVTAVRVAPGLVTPAGRLALDRADLVAFCHGEYFRLGRRLGYFGWSARRRKTARRR